MYFAQVRNSKFTAVCEAFTRAAAVTSILVGASAILSWWLNLPNLGRIYPGLAQTAPNSALSLVFIGIALWESSRRRVAVIFALVVFILSSLTFAEYALDRDLGIDRIFAPQSAIDSAAPVRMSPIGAVVFIAVSAALMMTLFEWSLPIAQMLSLLTSFLGTLVITGYVFQIRALFAVGTYTPMSAQMAVMSAVLGLGVLMLRHDRGLMSVLASPNVGGVVARRLLPIGIGFPFLLGLLAYASQIVRLGRTQFGGVIFLFVGILIFTAPILWTAGILYRTDKKREQAERHLAAQYEVARILSTLSPAHEVAQPVLEEICAKIGWDAAIIWEIEPDGKLLRPLAAINADTSPDPTLAANAFTLGQTLWTSGAAAFPIRTRDGTAGVIQCRTSRAQRRDDEVVLVMEAITAQIAQFVERKRVDREIRRLNRDLQERAGQLEAANKELEAFSYSVSHDLRAPLRHISGFVQLLAKTAGQTLDDRGNRYVTVIAESCVKMGQLVDDLLSFSRMSRAQLTHTRVDLNKILQQVKAELAPEAAGRNIEWAMEPLPEVMGDAAMLRIVLMNYVANALKYTRRKDIARITIGCSSTDTETTVFVQDNGAGFEMKYAGKLFGVFQRLHRDDEFEGTGIGLATARRVINRHGGRTWAEGAGGTGATFYFSLPHTNDQQGATVDEFIEADPVGGR